MRKTLIIAATAIALGLSSAAMAQTDTTDVNTPAAKTGAPSIDWPISDLLDNAAAHAVLAKDLPALLTYDGLDMIKGMSIRNISQYPQAQIDGPKLASIQADLSAIKP